MKAARVASRRRDVNKAARSAVKTNITTAEKLIVDGDLEAAETAVKTAVVSLDKAAEKMILHAKNAARRKARLVKKLNQAKPQPAAAAEEKPAD
jgi:small subunit ribosomal protein S20